RALQSDLDEINCVAYASDGYSVKNTGASASDRNLEAGRLVQRANAAGKRTSVTISVAFGDPIEGEVPPARVAGIANSLAKAGTHEIALGDTIGVADPQSVRQVVEAVSEAAPDTPIRCHFHNTRNTAVANSWAAYQAGARIIDASIGGLGGCPFAPKATGNVATEDITFMFERSGVKTGLDLDQLIAITTWLETELGRSLPAMVSRAGPFPTKDNQSS
ncbi:MAG: hydroxymethylglutaryl-CoA lyase, partial [Proteobacteria bacterium]|nr:hydroxymethylglutaryl-CoA lyase [Pseudomonadota bacterium]